MKITPKQLDDLIQQTQYGKPEGREDYWFSFVNQKRLAFNLAHDLVVDGVEVNEAVRISKEFIDAFYTQAVKPGSWER